MFGHPELVIPQLFQQLGEVNGPIEDLGELVIGIPAVVGRCPLETQAVIDNVAGVRSAKPANHEITPILAAIWYAPQSPEVAWMLPVALLVVNSWCEPS